MKPSVFVRRFLVPSPLISLACLLKFGCLAHYRSEIEYSRHLKIGRRTLIAAFTKLKADRGPLIIGENVSIADGCHIESSEAGVTIGNDCLLGPHVTIIGVNYAHDRLDIPFRMQPGQSKGIAIGQNVWIGSGACILDGSRIGNNVIVTPNSVVSAKVPDNVIVQGNPAKVIFTRR
jgi:acetyltransferase-like isoleucine patch superfamily enzyme